MNAKKGRIFISAAAITLAISSFLSFAACNDVGGSGTGTNVSTQSVEQSRVTDTELSYDDIDATRYVKSVKYKGLEITAEKNSGTNEELLWAAILETAEMHSYPEDKVEYFFNQMKISYMYLVDYDEEAYKMLLNNRNTTEEDMRNEARKMVKKDLVYRYIVTVEDLSISDSEKKSLFEKYVDKYVNDYGYTREYVKLNMSELIYDSMLYDKTMEMLLLETKIVSYTDTADTSANAPSNKK